ncbi:phospholipase D-like domain-containing protein [Namhaeicola litoreus]|uniref:Phosphatidylserine/phosphatidylglycerophosphate/ cardiolipin synthase family protein n=1 Tax=Namhaeicola litoreus TaxID=1052145 RepID=A0ABW3Y328_9FLAO
MLVCFKSYIQIILVLAFTIKVYAQKDLYAFKSDVTPSKSKTEKPSLFGSEAVSSFKTNIENIDLYFNSEYIPYLNKSPLSSLEFFNINYEKVDLLPNDLTFLINNEDSTIVSELFLAPESIQNLYTLNEVAYIENFKGEDFLEAKKNAFQRQLYSLKSYKFSKDYYQFFDWKSLNHPPVKQLRESLKFYDKKRTLIDYDTISSEFFSQNFHQLVDQLSGTNLTFGNELELLENGYSFDKKLELVRNAKKSILIAVMSFYKDSSAMVMANELIKKSKEGVHIVLVVEKVWTKLMMKKGLKEFPKNNITVIYADDLLKYDNHKRALFHNKIWVFDEETAIVGGQNILNSDNISTGFNHQSRDSDLLVRGPAVTDISKSVIEILEKYNYQKKCTEDQIRYIKDFQKSLSSRLDAEVLDKKRGTAIYQEKLENPDSRMMGVCRYIIQGPQNDKNLIAKVYLQYLNQVKYKIDLNTGKVNFNLKDKNAYSFFEGWEQQLWNKLFELGENGKEINLISNGIDGGYGELSSHMKRQSFVKNDKWLFGKAYPVVAEKLDRKAAHRNYPFLRAAQQKKNIDVWFYFQYMHSKSFMLDRFVVSVGSFNLDKWSADKSHESVLICQDKELAKQYEYNYVLDLVNSTPVPVKYK